MATLTKRITLKQVNAAIQQHYPKVFLVKGEGYYYIASDDQEWGIKLAGLYTTSIGVYKLSDYTIERWVADVKLLIEADGKRVYS